MATKLANHKGDLSDLLRCFELRVKASRTKDDCALLCSDTRACGDRVADSYTGDPLCTPSLITSFHDLFVKAEKIVLSIMRQTHDVSAKNHLERQASNIHYRAKILAVFLTPNEYDEERYPLGSHDAMIDEIEKKMIAEQERIRAKLETTAKVRRVPSLEVSGRR